MSSVIAKGLRALADALDEAPIEGEYFQLTPWSMTVFVNEVSDVCRVAARFGTKAERNDDGRVTTDVRFHGVELTVATVTP